MCQTPELHLPFVFHFTAYGLFWPRRVQQQSKGGDPESFEDIEGRRFQITLFGGEMNKKRTLALLSLLIVGSILIAACGPAATEGPVVEETEAPQAEATEVLVPETEEPKTEAPEETEIVGAYAVPWSFVSLDPSAGTDIEMTVFVNAYETLTYTPEYNTQLALPLLATDWESNEDGTVWTFHLRQGVKFHDGTDFTCEAVKYSYERTIRMRVGASYLLDPVEEIICADDYTVQINLSYPAPMDIIAASAYSAWIMSPTTTAEMAGDNEEWFDQGNDAGTGPYTIESYDRGQRVLMKKFDDYWAGWEPRSFDRVIIDIVEDAVVLQQMIEAGETDITFNIPMENLGLLEANPDINRVQENTFIVHFIHLNTQHPPLDNELVRQALAYSFPYDDAINVILEGYAKQAVTLIPEGAWGYCDTCFQYSYDLDKARDLLTQAGYPEGGFELEAVVMSGSYTKEQALELWKAELAKLGIDLTIVPMVQEAAYARARSSPEEAADMLAFSWWQDIVHPGAFLQLSFQCEEEIYYNFSYWCNQEYNDLLDAAFPISATNREEAIRMYEQAQDILIEEAPAIFLWQEIKNWLVRADIEGFVPNPAYTQAVFWKSLKRAE
jgi:peptide/nickel transport system substrate-binding protein